MQLTDDEWRNEALARGWNAHAVEHLSALWKSLRAAGLSPEAARFAVTDTIEKIGGARSKTAKPDGARLARSKSAAGT